MDQIKPMPGKVCLKVDDPPEKTPGGLYLPENVRDHCNVATVVSFSPLGWFEYGCSTMTFPNPELQPGTRVLVGKYSGVEVLIDEETFVILKQSDILAILESDPVHANT